jgi:anti-anti-sigma factor
MHDPSHDPIPEATIAVEKQGLITVALLVGEHDVSTANRLFDLLADQAGQEGVVVGLDDATFIDSHIVRSLYLAHSQLQKSDTPLVIQSSTHATVARVLEITGLCTTLPSADTLEHAIDTIRQLSSRDPKNS